MKQPKLIVFSGLDGAGKRTQAALLCTALRKRGYKVGSIAFPRYQTKTGKVVRKLLFSDLPTDPKEMFIPYAIDRYAALKQLTNPRLDALILDRYVPDNIAYLAAKLHLAGSSANKINEAIRWGEQFEYEILGLPRPGHVIFLDVPPNIASRHKLKYVTKLGRAKDKHEHDKALLVEVHKVCIRFSKKYPHWHRIACAQNGTILSKKTIHDKILAALALS